ncbi:MAG: FAD-dependent oxidoreductase, partial [Chitinophagaceae bacterium]|nr:FAD-dependent oxidoreductase [Chitinophagaceae bacterium]
RDLAALNRTGTVHPDSNYCFGEGGAGTYSDGKLYTRSSKRGNVQRILQIFHQLGAPDAILYQAHPHIGTNLLPRIITAMRQQILEAGGEFHFGQRVTNFTTGNGRVQEVITQSGEKWKADAVILATGHSARDIFELFHRQQWQLEAKPFALGVRIEHPQALIDSIQYHTPQRNALLPPASYSLVEQVNQRGVFSFCMCPGGIIAPAATSPGELVVNGWSPSKRNNPFANSGMVVQVELKDAVNFFGKKNSAVDNPLLLLQFQQLVEKKAFLAGGGNLVAPVQRMVDFASGKVSTDLPACSYLPGVHSSDLSEVLPDFIAGALRKACREFGKKMKGYFTNEAVLVATESRTSSPVRIPRDAEKLTHPQLLNLYPCGEGAGYAGGIVSAAMDGERVALAAAMLVKK